MTDRPWVGTQIINLTQLTLKIKASHEPDAPSREADSVAGMHAVRNVFGAVENLPEPQEDTLYIVSLPVGERCGGTQRGDLIGPNTNDAVYIVNDKGARVLDYCHGWV